jgi:hypothetical protein
MVRSSGDEGIRHGCKLEDALIKSIQFYFSERTKCEMYEKNLIYFLEGMQWAKPIL